MTMPVEIERVCRLKHNITALPGLRLLLALCLANSKDDQGNSRG